MTNYHLAGSYATAMRTVAEQARRNTHLIVATNKGTGEVVSQHARPRREAVEYRDTWRAVLGGEWTVRIVRVRKTKTTVPFWRG